MKNLGINELVRKIHANAKAHGWWDTEREFGTLIALMHSELSEALEEFREGKPTLYFLSKDEITTDMTLHNGEKIEGVAAELADTIIRIFDYCGANGIDIEQAILLKHEYNKSRSYRHGNKKV